MSQLPSAPAHAPCSTAEHRVSFFETDAMAIVHHSNYLRFFELARVAWLQEHDQAYVRYMESGLHFATTRSEVNYHRSSRFDDLLEITTWMQWVRGASLRMDYLIVCDGELIASGMTEHAAVNDDGRVRRIPAERRRNLSEISAEPDARRASS
jgi:acyl-CoA thioester hydrolase